MVEDERDEIIYYGERAYKGLLRTHERLLEALHEKHAATGFCPLCDAGPPPYHNPGCRAVTGAWEAPS